MSNTEDKYTTIGALLEINITLRQIKEELTELRKIHEASLEKFTRLNL